MSVTEAPTTGSLATRARNILLRPTAEWNVIEAEQPTTKGLFLGYTYPLAFIPMLASVLGLVLVARFIVILYAAFAWTEFFISAIITTLLAPVAIFPIAFIINILAPRLRGRANWIDALKLVSYSYTAIWVAGIITVIPLVGAPISALGGLYSIRLLYLGIPLLLHCPTEKAGPLRAVSIVASVIFYIGVSTINFTIGSFIGHVIAESPLFPERFLTHILIYL